MDLQGVTPLLQVFDMPTAIRFYRDVLGFEVWATSQPGDDCNWAGLRLNRAEVMLNTAYEADQRPPVADPARIAGHADTCLFFGCEDLDAAYQHLLGHGVNLKKPRVAPYGMKQLWFTDPRRVRSLLPVARHPGDTRPGGGGSPAGTKTIA